MTSQRVLETAQVAAKLKINTKCAVMYLASVYKPFAALVENPSPELKRHMESASDTIPTAAIESRLVADLCAVWEANGSRLSSHGQAIAQVAHTKMPTPSPASPIKPTSTPRAWVAAVCVLCVLAFSYAMLHA